MNENTKEIIKVAVRRASNNDVDSFNNLINNLGRVPVFRATFGMFNYPSIIEYSYLSLISHEIDEKASCCGFLALNDSTSCSADSDSFERAIRELAPFIPATVSNTLFINFWAIEERPKADSDIGAEIVREAFVLCPEVDFFVWLCPHAVRLNDYLSGLFAVVNTESTTVEHNDGGFFKGFRVLVLSREYFLPKLRVREARVEDNDDLVPILLKSDPQIAMGQEDYFLANLIQSQNEDNRFYVGINGDRPVGMLASSKDVNVDLLRKVFDVEAFQDLILKSANRPKAPPLRIGILGDTRMISIDRLDEVAQQLKSVHIDFGGLFIADGPNDVHVDQLVQVLEQVISQRCDVFVATHGEAPVACFFSGYPRCESDANLIINKEFEFDVLIEIAQLNAEGLNVEEDASALFSFEAYETLHSFFVGDNEAFVVTNGKTQWRKVVVDASDPFLTLSRELQGIVEARYVELGELGYNDENQVHANAFALTVFCMADEFESRAEDLLRVVFEDHPKFDYCLFMVPNGSSIPPSLTSHMSCAKVKTGVSFNQSLFVMHKEVLLAKENLQVQRMGVQFQQQLEKFMLPLGQEKTGVLDAAQTAMKENDVELKDNPGEACFVILADRELVGVVSLSRKTLTSQDLDTLRANYQLDMFVNYERHRMRSQAMITNWFLNPSFSRWTRFILREIMRRYEKTLLYFLCQNELAPAAEIVNEFLPVRPRRRMQSRLDEAPSKSAARVVPEISQLPETPLFLAAKKYLQQPKITVSSRIVIVSGSNFAASVLETLCFVPHLNFPNLYVIYEQPPACFLSDHDNCDVRTSKAGGAAGCLSVSDIDQMTNKELNAMGITFKCTLVRGRLTDIDRGNRAIVVSDEAIVEYDVLVISSPSQDNTVNTFPATKGMHPSTCNEKGIFGLGSPHVDNIALRWVLDRNDNHNNGVVVYGSGIDALAALGGLLQHIPAERISLVMPEKSLSSFGHHTVNETIDITLQNSGIAVYRGHKITDVTLNSHNFLQAVNLENKFFQGANDKRVTPRSDGGDDEVYEDDIDVGSSSGPYTGPQFATVSCTSLLCCIQKQCDTDAFAAINDSGLVYDGGVVVDETFRTVDPCIYAVGDYTKFSRLYEDALHHSRYNSRELGAYVGLQLLLAHLDPFSHSIKNRSTSVMASVNGENARFSLPAPPLKNELPDFRLPKSVSASFPCGLNFIRSVVPNLPGDLQDLISGEVCSENLTVLRLDQFGVLVELIHVGNAPIESNNMSCLVGLHEAFLNSAAYSFENGLVTDWVDFFRQDWASALYHDRFGDLLQDLREAVRTDKGMLVILDKVFEIADSSEDDQVVAAVRRKVIGDRGELLEDLTQKTIEAHTLDFVKKNKTVLTKFFVPQTNRQLNSAK